MEALPDELLLHIFERVADGATLLDGVSPVCKRWRRVAADPRAWAGVKMTVGVCDHGGGAPSRSTGEAPPPHGRIARAARILLHAPALRRLTLDLGARPSEDHCGRHLDRLFAACRRSDAVVRELHLNQCKQWPLMRDARWARRLGDALELLRRSGDHLRVLFVGDVAGGGAPDAWWRDLRVLEPLQRLGRLELDTRWERYGGELGATRLPALKRLVLTQHRSRNAQHAALLADAMRASSRSERHLAVACGSHGAEACVVPGAAYAALASCRELRSVSLPLVDAPALLGLPHLRTLRLGVRDTLHPEQRDALTACIAALRHCRTLDGLRELRLFGRWCRSEVPADRSLGLEAFAGLGRLTRHATILAVDMEDGASDDTLTRALLANLIRPMSGVEVASLAHIPLETLPVFAELPRLRKLSGRVLLRPTTSTTSREVIDERHAERDAAVAEFRLRRPEVKVDGLRCAGL